MYINVMYKVSLAFNISSLLSSLFELRRKIKLSTYVKLSSIKRFIVMYKILCLLHARMLNNRCKYTSLHSNKVIKNYKLNFNFKLLLTPLFLRVDNDIKCIDCLINGRSTLY